MVFSDNLVSRALTVLSGRSPVCW